MLALLCVVFNEDNLFSLNVLNNINKYYSYSDEKLAE